MGQDIVNKNLTPDEKNKDLAYFRRMANPDCKICYGKGYYLYQSLGNKTREQIEQENSIENLKKKSAPAKDEKGLVPCVCSLKKITKLQAELDKLKKEKQDAEAKKNQLRGVDSNPAPTNNGGDNVPTNNSPTTSEVATGEIRHSSEAGSTQPTENR